MYSLSAIRGLLRLVRGFVFGTGTLFAGCITTHGAQTVEPARFDYNEAISRSDSQQLLLNVVRLRYRDPPMFLALSNVVTQYEYVGRLGSGGAVSFGDTTTGAITPSANLEYRERPTLSYAPLSGEAFAERLLSPIAPQALLLLSQAGWSLERLMICCVDRINGLVNASTATGPTPHTLPDNRQIRRLAALVRELQNAGVLRVRLRPSDGPGSATLSFDRDGTATSERAAAVSEVERLLGVTPGLPEYPIRSQGVTAGPNAVDLRGRSLLGVMFAFSHAVAVPAVHLEAGLVTQSVAADGTPGSWDEVLGGMFTIRVSEDAPDSAFVAVRYREHWFFIDDGDLQTKTTFLLLNYLLALQSAAVEGRGPLLTLPS